MLVTRSNGRLAAQLVTHAAQLNAAGLGMVGTDTSHARQAGAGSKPRAGGLGTPRPPNPTHITKQGKTGKNTGHLPDFRVAVPKVI